MTINRFVFSHYSYSPTVNGGMVFPSYSVSISPSCFLMVARMAHARRRQYRSKSREEISPACRTLGYSNFRYAVAMRLMASVSRVSESSGTRTSRLTTAPIRGILSQLMHNGAEILRIERPSGHLKVVCHARYIPAFDKAVEAFDQRRLVKNGGKLREHIRLCIGIHGFF